MRRLELFAGGLLALALAAPAAAHDLAFTDTVVLLKTDGSYQVDLACDLDALLLGVAPTTDALQVVAAIQALSPEELAREEAELAQMFLRRVRVRVDGEPVMPSVTFPDREAGLAATSTVPTVLGTTARLTGRLSPGAELVTLQVSSGFPPVVLAYLHQASGTGWRRPLEQGVEGPPMRVSGPWPRSPEMAGTSEGAAEEGAIETAGTYVKLGFEHILPAGIDHVLFVLGLFLLSTRWRPLLMQVTAFTLAHTVTLALATLGVVSLPSRLVETVIALSIAWVAIENVVFDQPKPWRPALVFGFGLLHGLGFAGVLAELGLPEGQLWTALLSFNVGVELGQLTVLALAFGATWAWRDKPWYWIRVVVPASLAIAAVGLFWAVQRAM
ncbi:MAG TPA: HupE/UreJ family protein [Thermoanaerobaculia bacterium]|nr:HupE/UreJ family protein [Thermoanaerobaculia bacterium]